MAAIVEKVANLSLDHILPLSHQVAGNYFGKGHCRLRILGTKDGKYVLKPLQIAPKGERELNFYKKLFISDDTELNEDEKELKSLNILANFYGCYCFNQITYIKIDDLAAGLTFPAIIDLKIGIETYDPEATNDQISRHKSKYPHLIEIGFQIEGMRVFNSLNSQLIHFDKEVCRSFDSESVLDALAFYFQLNQKKSQTDIIKEILKKLKKLETFFSKQTSYHFYSSSLLIAYEGKPDDTDLNNNATAIISLDDKNVRVILADFAHVFPGNSKIDVNYLTSLRRLIFYLNELVNIDFSLYDFKLIKELIN